MVSWGDIEKLASEAVDTVVSAADEAQQVTREAVSEALETAANWIKPEETE